MTKSSDEWIISAKLFASQGNWADAKKALRRVLIIDPDHRLAKSRLNEIQANELQDLLSVSAENPSKIDQVESEPTAMPTDTNVDNLLEEILAGDGHDALKNRTEQTMVESVLREKLFEKVRDFSERDWFDLGVAALEMDLMSVAQECFERSANDPRYLVHSKLLEAQIYFKQKRYFDATQIWMGLVNSRDDTLVLRLEAAYWLARVCEAQERIDEAKSWYQQVLDSDPTYRDTQIRFKDLKT